MSNKAVSQLPSAASAQSTDLLYLVQSGASKSLLVSLLWGQTGQKVAVPASSAGVGLPGQWALDQEWWYAYVGDGVTHLWMRVGIATW